MKRAAAVAAAALALGALTACSGPTIIVGQPPATPSAAAPSPVAAAAPAPAPATGPGSNLDAESEFRRVVRIAGVDGTAVFRAMTDYKVTKLGYDTCAILEAGVGPEGLLAQLSPDVQGSAAILMTAAAETLCPAQNPAVQDWLTGGTAS